MLNNGKLFLRFAEEKDIPVILSLIKELAEYEKLLDEVRVTEEILKENLFGKRRYAEVIIAELDGKTAGQALFFHNFSTFLGKPGIYLEDLYVKQEFRGKGIGKALLNKIIEIAKERIKNTGKNYSVTEKLNSAIQMQIFESKVEYKRKHLKKLQRT